MASAIRRPLLVVALAAVAGFLVQAADPTVETCSIGQTWVSNFIKFECYSDSQIVEGVRPIGCVPNNTATGAVISAGQTYNSPNFVYQCSKPSSNSMEYKIINCLDTAGKTLGIGETRTMSDGTTLKCSTGTDGQVLLTKVVVNGCVFQGKVYGMGAVYFSNETTKATVKGKEVLIGVGTGYICQKHPNGTFVNQAKTCALPNRENGLNLGAYAAVGEVIVKCSSCDASPDGVCKLVVDESVACTYNGQAYKQNDFFNDTTGTIHYVCNLGKIEIAGCWVQNVWIRERNVKVVNGVQYFCGAGGSTNWTIVDKGCTLSNGTLFPYHLQWQTPDAVYQCDPVRTGDNVTAFIRQQRCKINGTLILIDGTVVLPSGVPYKCANNGTMWVARLFNDAEMAAWKASQPSTNSSVVQGDGGSGSGNGVIAATTTARPTAPPATTPRAVSTTPAPATLRIEPSTTTTAAEASKASTTPGAGQTTSGEGTCHDSFEFCASLAPVCQTHGSAVLQVREILSKSNLTADEYKKIFDALSLGEENDELKWEVQGLFGSLASGPKDGGGSPCGCSEDDDDCNDRCGRTSSCKRCGIFKRKLRDMVKLACPRTCNNCGTVGHMKDLVGILVRFYRHDCE